MNIIKLLLFIIITYINSNLQYVRSCNIIAHVLRMLQGIV